MDHEKRILAIETSGRHGSVALLEGENCHVRLIGQYIEKGSERTAQSLAPSIDRLLKEAKWSAASVDLVAVAVGPGSFTGLRIGVTTAKAFAYAADAEVIGVNTLEAIATQAVRSSSPLWVVSDAQRQELFAAKFLLQRDECPRAVLETAILGQDEWLAGLQPGDRVTGPALSRLQKQLRDGVETISQTRWQPTAESVARLAWSKYRRRRGDDIWKLAPLYYRASAAEEKKPM